MLKFHALLAASLVVSLTAGCGMSAVPLTANSAFGAFNAMAKPVSDQATTIAAKWEPDAAEMAVSISRATDGGDDVPSYLFTSKHKPQSMLVVASTSNGLQSQEMPLSGSAANGFASMLPITDPQGVLLDSKVLFSDAVKGGMLNPADLVVLHSNQSGQDFVMAVVTDAGSKNCLVLDATTGDAMGPVQPLGARQVQMFGWLENVVQVVERTGLEAIQDVKNFLNRLFHHTPKPAPSPAPSAAPQA
ncbi:MAG TPA: hypothetical protein V6D47_09530 [Oscillatoriaceae cyanobacterium]